MSVVGVLSNVHSRRNSRSMADVHAIVSAHQGVRHVAIHRFSALHDGLAALARQGVDHLVISGGDGTVHAVVTELINRSPFPAHPRLSILAGGTTNVIARDVASVQHPAWALKRLLERSAAGDPGEAVERRTIAMRRSGETDTIHGFLVGAIGFYQGTLLSRRRLSKAGRHHRLFGSLSVLWTLGRVLRHGFGEESGIMAERVGLTLDGEAENEQDLLLVLATTLESLVPGFMPFWGDGAGRLRLTTIASPGRHFLRAAWSMARGRPRPWMAEAGYCSGRVDRASIHLSSPLIMDGEIFQPGPGRVVELSTGPGIAFARY